MILGADGSVHAHRPAHPESRIRRHEPRPLSRLLRRRAVRGAGPDLPFRSDSRAYARPRDRQARISILFATVCCMAVQAAKSRSARDAATEDHTSLLCELDQVTAGEAVDDIQQRPAADVARSVVGWHRRHPHMLHFTLVTVGEALVVGVGPRRIVHLDGDPVRCRSTRVCRSVRPGEGQPRTFQDEPDELRLLREQRVSQQRAEGAPDDRSYVHSSLSLSANERYAGSSHLGGVRLVGLDCWWFTRPGGLRCAT